MSATYTVRSLTKYSNSMSVKYGEETVAVVTPPVYSQKYFEFDLSHLGLSLSELKSALRKLTVRWTGYGSGSNGGVKEYGARLRVWDASTSSWTYQGWRVGKDGTASSPETLTATTWYPDDVGDYHLTSNQKVYVLVHSMHPAGTATDGTAVIPSEIYTDYISLDVELADYVDYKKTNIIKANKVTKEMKLQFPATSNRYLGSGGGRDAIELWYKTTPIQDIVEAGKAGEYGKVIAYGKGIITNAKHNEGIGINSITEYTNFMDRFAGFNQMDLVDLGKTQPDTLMSALDTTGLNSYFDWGSSIQMSNYHYGKGSIIGKRLKSHSGKVNFEQYAYDFLSIPKEVKKGNIGFMIPLLVESDSGDIRVYVLYGKSYVYANQLYLNGQYLANFLIEGRPLLK